jgi:hypothetical protein
MRSMCCETDSIAIIYESFNIIKILYCALFARNVRFDVFAAQLYKRQFLILLVTFLLVLVMIFRFSPRAGLLTHREQHNRKKSL